MAEPVTNKSETLPPTRTVELAVWGGLGLIVIAIVVAFIATQLKAQPLPVYAELPPFSLTNQDGRTVTLDDLRGKVWIADAIFTRCPSQCLIMSAHLKQIQSELPASEPIGLVSFTTDPGFDQPPVLKKYAERFSADDSRWLFLTGTKPAVRSMELDGLKLSVVDKPAGAQESRNDLFIHSEKFVLIDKLGQIRGWFDGEQDATLPVIVAAAKRLARD